MKPFEYYAGGTARPPLRADFTCIYAYSRGEVTFSGSLTEWERLGRTDSLSELSFDVAGYRAALDRYNARALELTTEFAADLFADTSMTGDPRALEALQLAHDISESLKPVSDVERFRMVTRLFTRLAQLCRP